MNEYRTALRLAAALGDYCRDVMPLDEWTHFTLEFEAKRDGHAVDVDWMRIVSQRPAEDD